MADCTLADCADALLMLCLLSMPGETERSVGKREPEQLDPSLPGHLQKPEEARARAQLEAHEHRERRSGTRKLTRQMEQWVRRCGTVVPTDECPETARR